MIPASDYIVLDTNILVAYTRANDLAKAIESEYQLLKRSERPIICVVTRAEILSLARKLNWAPPKVTKMIEILGELVEVDINSQDVLDHYIELDHAIENAKPKPTIDQNDLWIAAVTAAADATLITTDKDFTYIPKGLFKLEWVDEAIAKRIP